jgi:hypothetical protein
MLPSVHSLGRKDPNNIRRRPSGVFPDLHVTIEDIIAEGDKVVVRNVWRQTTGRISGRSNSWESSFGELPGANSRKAGLPSKARIRSTEVSIPESVGRASGR